MEMEFKIRATQEEMNECFRFDEVLNIRYGKEIGPDLYHVRIRMPECEGIETSEITTFEKIKKSLIEKCPKEFGVVGEAQYANGKRRKFYSANAYWLCECAKYYSKVFETELIRLKRM